MAQTFRLMAPREKLAYPLWENLEDTLFGYTPGELVYKLAVPAPRRLPHFSPKQSPVSAIKPLCDGNGVAKRLSSLPTELHLLIFSFIEDPLDLVSFGITSQYFLPIACEFVERYYMSFWGNWARKNIVCVELEALHHKTSDIPEDLLDPNNSKVIVPEAPFTLHHFILPTISTIKNSGRLEATALSLNLLRGCKERGISEDSAFRYISPHLNLDKDTYFPTDQQWILRNLTTKEIVYPNAIAVSPKCIRGPHMSMLGFGQVVMSRIFWSTSGSVSLSGAQGICRENGQGTALILLRYQDEAETSEEEWTDISDEVAREIGSIWEGEYGRNWRERLKHVWESMHPASRTR
ncbi:hypothetical protein F5Y01DRAFT_314025 [Xylaria sp. FL0043]|nr:hypothetical protein F5Y01DRAFT_314025 [Xylaria sp. FL0043]